MYVGVPNIFKKMCVRRRCTELGIVHRIYTEYFQNDILYSGQNEIVHLHTSKIVTLGFHFFEKICHGSRCLFSLDDLVAKELFFNE